MSTSNFRARRGSQNCVEEEDAKPVRDEFLRGVLLHQALQRPRIWVRPDARAKLLTFQALQGEQKRDIIQDVKLIQAVHAQHAVSVDEVDSS